MAADTDLIEPVRPFVKDVVAGLDSVPPARQALLNKTADYISGRLRADESANLIFICTHNSRRSHLAQVWCQVAASYYDVPDIKTFSGGTEATACNIRTVRSLRRSGLSVVASTIEKNPVYLIQFSEHTPPLAAFSKVYGHEANPQKEFAAMMCCGDADEKCPVVSGADRRFALHYEDPKVADDTAEEAERYDERSLQIAQEMFFLMSKVAEELKAE
jgi:arsenate reductase